MSIELWNQVEELKKRVAYLEAEVNELVAAISAAKPYAPMKDVQRINGKR